MPPPSNGKNDESEEKTSRFSNFEDVPVLSSAASWGSGLLTFSKAHSVAVCLRSQDDPRRAQRSKEVHLARCRHTTTSDAISRHPLNNQIDLGPSAYGNHF